jgi:CRISPR/Cas system CMR subunit Cmr4 (Cas7 group RAMP superfamily)
VLQDLASRATAVQARIVLDSEKKTSKNLWYEESLPDDCLFCCIIATRPEARPYERSDSRWRNLDPLSMLRKILGGDETKKAIVECTQIGGNATVGMGQCRWVLIPKWENDHGSKKE